MRCVRILPVSFIPFDAGGWTDKGEALLHNYVARKAQLRRTAQSDKERVLAGSTAFQFVTTDALGRRYTFDIFPDGFGVTTTIDVISTIQYDELHPSRFLTERRSRHLGILDGSHQISDVIRGNLDGLRATLAGVLEPRRSAGSTWRRSGLAYVFTMYFLEVTDDEVSGASQGPLLSVHSLASDEAFRRKVNLMLEPSAIGIIDTPSFESQAVHILGEHTEGPVVLPDNCELSGHYWSCVSWSTAIVLGPIAQLIIDDYVFLEKRLQHAWFKVLCLSDHVESLPESAGGKQQDMVARALYETRTQLSSVKSITEPSIGSRYFNILTRLVDTSRFEQHVEALKDRLELLSSTMQRSEERNRNRYQKVVQALLFIFAFLQAISVLTLLDQIGHPYALAVLGVLLAIGIVFLVKT